jgi:glycosyltransferase involved in cell wall biosynthesis
VSGAVRVRVLWLIKGLGPGGAEALLVNQARVLDTATVEAEAAYLVPWKDHLVPDLAAAGVPATCLDGAREWDLRWAWRLRRRLRRRPVDVIHVHSPYVAGITRLTVRTLPRRVRPALVSTEHNRWPRHSRPTRILNRLTMRLDDVDLAVSEDVRSTIPPRLARRVEALEHGVDVEAVRARLSRRDAVRAELGVGPEEVVVGIVANFRREKAYEVFLAAAAEAAASDPRLRFVSVGQGPLEDEMRALADRLGLTGRASILGYRPDAVEVMSAFDLFSLSSRHEGLPVSLMEALVLGLPVVATAVGGIPEAVTDGVEGLLVPPDDPSALAAAWLALAADPDRRARMAAAARTRGERFGIEPAARRLEQLYREAAERRVGRAPQGRQPASARRRAASSG